MWHLRVFFFLFFFFCCCWEFQVWWEETDIINLPHLTKKKKKKFSHPFTLLPLRSTSDSPKPPKQGFLPGPHLKLEKILWVLFDCSWDSVSNNSGWPQTLYVAEVDPELLILLPGYHGWDGTPGSTVAVAALPTERCPQPLLFCFLSFFLFFFFLFFVFPKSYFSHSLWCCVAHVGVLAICEII